MLYISSSSAEYHVLPYNKQRQSQAMPSVVLDVEVVEPSKAEAALSVLQEFSELSCRITASVLSPKEVRLWLNYGE